MRIRIDPDKCQGHARCFAILPELIDVDDYGTSSVIGDGTVPGPLVERARLAIANCPEFAIEEVESDGTGPAGVGGVGKSTSTTLPPEIHRSGL